jgi:NAD(P)-dependent dehydrogenase (short-subunit alcohol dehydrogenase family)
VDCQSDAISARFALKGRTALVTGASGGLGEVFARALGAMGARVVVTSRRKDRLDGLVLELERTDCVALALDLDVADPPSVMRAFDQLDAAGWLVDVVVNNAGLALRRSWFETDEADWDGLLQVNLLGADRVARAACRRLVAAGRRGTVINIASVLGITVQAHTAAYGSSKAALIHLTKAMALEMARHGITVNCIAPGGFRTPMLEDFARSAQGEAYLRSTVSRRLGEPDELVGTLLYLASGASAYVTGVVIPIDGGNHLRAL